MSKKINSYKAMSVLTRGFFEAFANGIIDCQILGNDFKKKHNPQNIKQAMLEHYEEISAHFLDIMFPALARLNYPDEKKMQEKLKKEFTDKQADMAQYLRFACKTDKLYEAMVNASAISTGFCKVSLPLSKNILKSIHVVYNCLW